MASEASLPVTTSDVGVARAHLDEFGYCLFNALDRETVRAVRARLLEQREAEERIGVAHHLPDGKQLVKFLLNKGEAFRELLFHPGVRTLVGHVLGPVYLLSSYHAHIAHPGGTRAFHTDQFWMPPPVRPGDEAAVKPGAITRDGNRGRHVGERPHEPPPAIAPAFVCNAMWMLDDFTASNGATILVPGSHLSGRQPDAAFDLDASWVAAQAPAGTVLVFEGRVWHSTGENVSDAPRIGLTTNFCAPQCRQQENFLLGTRPEVLDAASDELLALIGFKAWHGYGGYETHDEFVRRGEYALGEMRDDTAD